ncbi:DUF2130 domain-containing protein [Mycoplasma sp. CSL7491-lung]|uniref:DUF2130 domain-containing protein n=1 Tax=Mycoplasma sp. CSL7491-lung TaxID=549718 RepID=UPI001C0FFEBC|nr:DUF2130 domain-containing protein [Mycoplasma sp. CSL7491-lung]MBU4693244.1 DUF2130 domain-containing protein [Mycoplasma sp. CSL7491-lung]
MKKIKIKISDIEKLEFIVEEDAKKGDYFTLSDLLDNQQSIIESAKSDLIKKITDSSKNNWEKEWKVQYDNLKKVELLEKIKEKEEEVRVKTKKELEQQKQNEINTLKDKFKEELAKEIQIIKAKEKELLGTEINKLKEENIKLSQELKNNEVVKKQEIQTLLSKQEVLISQKTTEINNTYQNKILTLETNKNKLEEQLKIVKEQETHKYESQLNEIKAKLTEQFHNKELNMASEYQKTIEKLKFDNESLKQKENEYKQQINSLEISEKKHLDIINKNVGFSTKQVGENFENSIYNLLEDSFGFMGNEIKFSKTTENIDRTKPDFEINLFKDKENIGNIIIEAKSKQTETGSTTNKKHLPKLLKDMKNYKGTFGVLVTELEPEHNFLFKVYEEYPNIFVVRFEGLKPLLQLLINFIKERSNFDNTQLDIEEQRNLIVAWNEKHFKAIVKAMARIKDDFDDINKFVENIQKNLDDLKGSLEISISKHIDSFSKAIVGSAKSKLYKNIKNIEPRLTKENSKYLELDSYLKLEKEE